MDRLAAEVLAPLAVWVFASGLDDLILDLLYIRILLSRRRARKRAVPGTADMVRPAEQRIALMVPCWQEDAVIAQMLDHNLATIDYQSLDIWLGVYPNDEATIARVEECEIRHPNVRHVVCPHDGPTTKADNLNWLWQGIRMHEMDAGEQYDIIMQHDAEDLIHPRSLAEVNRLMGEADMVQVPVFPLRLPVRELVHGTYGDEFAEYHLKDMIVRTEHGGFMPSAGVGTAYRRAALDELRDKHGEVFNRESLTEDYVMGYFLRELGARQSFVAALESVRAGASDGGGDSSHGADLLATGEYFPRIWTYAIRQRTRWMTGIILQAWDQVGWGSNPRQWYWLWRDRKGIIGHPLTLLANVLFLYGVGSYLWAVSSDAEWELARYMAHAPWLDELLVANMGVLIWRQLSRGACTYRIYGWVHALTVPLRAPVANLINVCCVFRALRQFVSAKIAGRPLRWDKTAHAFPEAEGAAVHGQRVGEVLVSLRFLDDAQLAEMIETKPDGMTIGEHIVRTGMLGEAELYEALSEHEEMPLIPLEARQIDPKARAVLPVGLATHWRLIAYRIDEDGCLWLAGPEPVSTAAEAAVARCWPGERRFVLITQSNYAMLTGTPLAAGAAAGDSGGV